VVYGLNVRPIYNPYPSVESLDDRFEKHFTLKKQFQPPLPMKDGKVDFAAIKRVLPAKMKWKDSADRQMPDFDRTPALNVSERVRQVIEEIEPGVHKFEPVEYTYARGGLVETRYWLKMGNELDSLDRDHTTMVLDEGIQWVPPRDLLRRGKPIPPHIDPEQKPRLVFILARIGDTQMWNEPLLNSGNVFMSDRMAQALRDAGPTGIELVEYESV
jgi:hypothetical protein